MRKVAEHHLQGRANKLNNGVLIQRFSLVDKKGYAIVVETHRYVMLIATNIRCNNSNVTVSIIFFLNQLEYLPCDELRLSPCVWRRYNSNIVGCGNFRHFRVEYITLDMGKLPTAGESNWRVQNNWL